jgi:hypothetical protein
LEFEECEQQLLQQEQELSAFSDHEEVVLWFEHDLFCQTILIYLLNWFNERDLNNTRLSLVCIGEFPGRANFRGLGELSAGELASLFPDRRPVTSAQLKLGTSAWQAYSSPKPTDIEKLLQTDTSSLPFLRTSLLAQLRRFPALKNGLGIIENRSLKLIAGGARKFSDLFSQFGDAEPAYGLGDAQFWLALRRLTDIREPLLRISGRGHATTSLTPDIIEATFDITEQGKSVLAGEADFVNLNGIDQWLGGVHLSNDGNVWRWNEESQRISPEVNRP